MEREKLMKFLFVIVISILGIFFLLPIFSQTNNKTKIVFFGLGKADSIYIENGSNNLLIDTGLKSQRDEIIFKLEELGVRKLDYMILTHPDKDHIGSASYILDHFDIGELIQSNHFKDTKREARIKNVIEEKEIKNTRLTSDMKFDLGEMKVTILTPERDDYKKDNDHSLVTLIEDGDLKYLFAGDAEKDLLEEMLEKELPAIDIYKVPHHGRKNSNSKEMVEKIFPKHSIITNFEKDGEIDDILSGVDSQVRYVYDKDLRIYSDGKKIEFR